MIWYHNLNAPTSAIMSRFILSINRSRFLDTDTLKNPSGKSCIINTRSHITHKPSRNTMHFGSSSFRPFYTQTLGEYYTNRTLRNHSHFVFKLSEDDTMHVGSVSGSKRAHYNGTSHSHTRSHLPENYIGASDTHNTTNDHRYSDLHFSSRNFYSSHLSDNSKIARDSKKHSINTTSSRSHFYSPQQVAAIHAFYCSHLSDSAKLARDSKKHSINTTSSRSHFYTEADNTKGNTTRSHFSDTLCMTQQNCLGSQYNRTRGTQYREKPGAQQKTQK